MIVTDTVEDNKLPDIQVNQESQGAPVCPRPTIGRTNLHVWNAPADGCAWPEAKTSRRQNDDRRERDAQG